MKSRFRWMERVHREVVKEEKRTGRQSGGLLIMDLNQLRFSPSLLSVIGGSFLLPYSLSYSISSGPYRIMWGTLFEQYPQMIQEIVIINAPTFVNLLYQTCIPFIPADYKVLQYLFSISCESMISSVSYHNLFIIFSFTHSHQMSSSSNYSISIHH